MQWLPWVLLGMAILLWWLHRGTTVIDMARTHGIDIEPFLAQKSGGFWDRVKDLQAEDVRRFDRMMKELEQDRDHPFKMSEYEEYFSSLGISNDH